MQKAVNMIKAMVEKAIITNGISGKNNLIRTSTVIDLIHNAVKQDLIKHNIPPHRIVPPLNNTKGELSLYGSLKKKAQDISVLPPSDVIQRSLLITNGAEIGNTDVYGKDYTERVLTINVRSQLSSLAKNIDTLYERTFAESYNLHSRCPKMVLGELYMIPVYEYDDVLAASNQVGFKNNKINLEKYISAFQNINDRNISGVGEEHKYEKVCLLIVDFSRNIPKIYNSTQELINDGLLPTNTTVSINNLSFFNFTNNLISTYISRFGAI